jgi:signal transduction histidine kinase
LQRNIALREISALEKERSRIAADLHDDLGPLLSAIKFRINSVDTLSAEDKNEIVVSSGLLDDSISRLKEISNDLLPTALIRKGLIEAIQEFIILQAETSGLDIRFDFSPNITISKERDIHLFRMIQEGVFNCIKHANATRILITLNVENNLHRLRITDNGIGIKKLQPDIQFSGRGLISLENRATILGGTLYIHSEPGKGTILDFEIPL